MSGDIIYLNVGGMKYCTSKNTLTKYPLSMLGAMFSQNISSSIDRDGCYFIDRNGKVFEYILQFLRSDQLILPDDFKDYNLLKCEAEFYQILPLLDSLIHYNRIICVAFVDSYAVNAAGIKIVLCQRVNNHLFEKKHQVSHTEHHKKDDEHKKIATKKIIKKLLGETWTSVGNEEEIFTDDDFHTFLVATGFSQATMTILQENKCGFYNEKNRIKILCYKKQ